MSVGSTNWHLWSILYPLWQGSGSNFKLHRDLDSYNCQRAGSRSLFLFWALNTLPSPLPPTKKIFLRLRLQNGEKIWKPRLTESIGWQSCFDFDNHILCLSLFRLRLQRISSFGFGFRGIINLKRITCPMIIWNNLLSNLALTSAAIIFLSFDYALPTPQKIFLWLRLRRENRYWKPKLRESRVLW